MKYLFFSVCLIAACLSSCGSPTNSDKDIPSEETVVVEPVRVEKSNRFYEGLLNDFLKKHFRKEWPGESYFPNSLRVENFHSLDANTDEIMGTFSFEGRFGKDYDDREYKAQVHDDGDGKYHVTFFRRKEHLNGLRQGDWVSIMNKPFIYEL